MSRREFLTHSVVGGALSSFANRLRGDEYHEEAEDLRKQFQPSKQTVIKSPDKDKPELGSHAEVKETSIKLWNRGVVISEADFAKDVTISFRWTVRGGDGAGYNDVLAVCVHTDARLEESRPNELAKGIVVRFEAHGRRMKVEHFNGVIPNNPDTRVDRQMPAILKGITYDIKVVVSNGGQYIEAFVDSRKVGEIAIPLASQNAGEAKIAFYNRERGGAGTQESVLEDVKIVPGK